MLTKTTIVLLSCTITLRAACMDYETYLDLEAPIHGEPCSTTLPNDVWKTIADFMVKQNPENTRALRSTCTLLYEYLPEPPNGSMRYRLWQQRKDEETIRKRNKIIKTTLRICYCGIWLPAMGGTALALFITDSAWKALIPLGTAAGVHGIGACIGYECQDYWHTF